jgi:uncharacterized membrane protein
VDSAAHTAPVPSIRAIGTEPFWGLRIDAAGLRFTTPEDTAGRWLPVTTPARIGDTLRWVGAVDQDSFDIRIWKATCSDGMSDNEYPYTATVRIGDRDLMGCARE